MSSLFLLFLLHLLRHCHAGCGAEDSTLNIQRICGIPYTITLTYDSTQREVSMYIPQILCNDIEFVQFIHQNIGNGVNGHHYSFNVSQHHQVTLPMLISLHCLGCSPSDEMAKWKPFAEEFTFILIAPQGIGSSWNADQCCDPAVDRNVDDVGFIQTVVNGAQTSFSSIFPMATVSNPTYDGYLWINGFSNGGFMTDKIAWQSTVHQFSKIVAVAPMAGYIYDRSKYIKNSIKNKDKHNAVAIYLHHSSTDTMVSPNGCCADDTAGCCCGIAQRSSSLQCLSVIQEFEDWMAWNHCDEGLRFEDLKMDSIIHSEIGGERPVEVECAMATPQDNGCDVLTSLCLHRSNTHHGDWTRHLPQARNVMVFFLKALCHQQQGYFNEATVRCECGMDSEFVGMHCITKKGSLGMESMDTFIVTADEGGIGLVANTERSGDAVIDVMDFKETEGVTAEEMIAEEITRKQEEEIIEEEEAKPGWKETVRSGKKRKKNLKENRKRKGLSVVGSAGSKYSTAKSKKLGLDALATESGVSSQWFQVPNSSLLLIGSMLFAALGLLVMYFAKRQTGYKYSKVLVEDDEENIFSLQ